MFGRKKSDEPKVSHVRKSLGAHQWTSEQPDPLVTQALAPGAMFALSWKWNNDDLMGLPGPKSTPEASIKEARAGLSDSWGIPDGQAAVDTLNALLSGMHSPVYELVTPFVVADVNSALTGKDLKAFRASNEEQVRDAAREAGMSVEYVDGTFKKWRDSFSSGMRGHLQLPDGELQLPEHVMAWDLTRATFIARLAFTAGYIPEDVAWQAIAASHDIITQTYTDWEGVREGHFIGYGFWASASFGFSTSIHINGRRQTLDALFEPEGPWARFPLTPLPGPDDLPDDAPGGDTP